MHCKCIHVCKKMGEMPRKCQEKIAIIFDAKMSSIPDKLYENVVEKKTVGENPIPCKRENAKNMLKKY